MDDIRLWNLLDDHTRGAEAPAAASEPLRAMLEDLAGLPLAERWPFFGRLSVALAQPDAAVRAAAVRALAGATGLLAWRAIVRALDDDAGVVRDAAARALGTSASSEPSRWVHAAFNRRPDVRAAALAHPPGRRLPWFAIFLLPDDACRDALLADLPEKVPPDAVFAVLEFARRKLLSADQAAGLIADMGIEQLYEVLSRVGPWRSEKEVDASLREAANTSASSGAVVAALRAAGTADVLDEVVELFWSPDATRGDTSTPAEPTPRERFFSRLANWAIDRKRPREGDRVRCAILTLAARLGTWDDLAAQVVLLLDPDFLSFAWVPRAHRRAAVAALHRHRTRLETLPDGRAEVLLRLPICTRENGLPDLWVVGGILHWAGGEPYKLAVRVFTLSAIVSAFLDDPVGSAPMFANTNDPPGRKRILQEIGKRSRHGVGSLMAGLVLVSAADELSFLDDLDGRGAMAVFQALLTMTTATPPATLSDNKVRRLAEILAPKLNEEHFEDMVRAIVDAPGAEHDALAHRVLSLSATLAGADRTAASARRLDPERLKRLLEMIPTCAGFPYGAEAALAHALARHRDPAVRAWAVGRIAAPSSPPPEQRTRVATVRVDDATAGRIETCATAVLATEVEPFFGVPSIGLTKPLAARPRPPGMHSVAVCTALLGSYDPVDEVAEQFAAYSADEPEFLKKLDAAVVKHWAWKTTLPLLGNCWLHLWDPHCFAAAPALLAWSDGLVGALRWALSLSSIVLCRQVFETVARTLSMWRYREKSKLLELDLDGLCTFLVSVLPGDMGVPAAKALVTVYQSRAAEESMRHLTPQVSGMLPELADDVRAALADWTDSRGLVTSAPARTVVPGDPAVLRRIAACADLDELDGYCRTESSQQVQDATLRLIELGEPGLRRLVTLLTSEPAPPLAVTIAESVPLFPEGEAVDELASWFAQAKGSSELLLLIGLGLLERGDQTVLPALFDVCTRPCETAWFRRAHWDRFLAAGVTPIRLAIELARSPHPHAYLPALEVLLGLPQDVALKHDAVVLAVIAFLEAGSERRHELRVLASARLNTWGEHAGFPLLLGEAIPPKNADRRADWEPAVLGDVPPALVRDAVLAVLYAGPQTAAEGRLLELLEHTSVDRSARDAALATLVKDASLDRTLAQAIAKMRGGAAASRDAKLRRLARTFAWGVVTGREITGRLFAVEMNAGQGLGYTRLETDKVWITPLPILRGEQHAEAVTRGLIVHEFGHHMYHRSPEALAVWEKANGAGYHGLLNLVSDEHLERNLRALDDDFGDDLKKLAAFAFQHSDKEVPLDALLRCLQARAFEVLTAADLGVARRRGCVAVNNGRLLAHMERAGMSFSRFVRALRMGLGNRAKDPKVAEALALFKGQQFRKSSMAELRDVALRVRNIFGWEAVLMETFAQDALLSPDAAEVMSDSDGITPDELREAIRRLLEDRRRRHGGPRSDEGEPVRQMNLGADESFSTITTVVPVPFDPVKHATYAKEVAGPARQMRRFLSQLGLRMVPQRFRVQGKRVDRARIVPAGILRGDPRLLISRVTRIEADLFLGLVIDCSGSMQMSDHMEKAKLFGALLAEAAKGLEGIDVRVFGFTDSVIYDAGDAHRCSAHNLQAEGGNNDAAALWHAAQAARASRRRARLLVMISDGAPTECTTSALKALALRLGQRMNICCAQIAVCPLEVKCFANYIELGEHAGADAVRRFGMVITRLVKKVIA